VRLLVLRSRLTAKGEADGSNRAKLAVDCVHLGRGRGIFIMAGIDLLKRWHPVVYVFAVFLVVTTIRTAAVRTSSEHPRLMAFARKLRLVDHHADGRFFVYIDFALDSISSAFAITTRPFILYSSNVLGVRPWAWLDCARAPCS